MNFVECEFCELRLLGILRTSHLACSTKFAPRNSHQAYKDRPYGGCPWYLMLATVAALYNPAGLTSPALYEGGWRLCLGASCFC
jgi:hypothetical protein